MYEGQYRDLVFYTSRIFEPRKRRRVGISDDSSEPSLLPYTKYGCLAERIHVVYLTCSSLKQPSIFFFSSFIINFLSFYVTVLSFRPVEIYLYFVKGLHQKAFAKNI